MSFAGEVISVGLLALLLIALTFFVANYFIEKGNEPCKIKYGSSSSFRYVSGIKSCAILENGGIKYYDFPEVQP